MWTLSPNQRRRAYSPSLLKRTLTMSYKNLGTAPIVLRIAALILARRVTLTRGIGLAADSPVAAKSQLKAITFGLVIGGDFSPQLEERGLRRNTLQESKGCKLGKAISSETQESPPTALTVRTSWTSNPSKRLALCLGVFEDAWRATAPGDSVLARSLNLQIGWGFCAEKLAAFNCQPSWQHAGRLARASGRSPIE